MLLPQLLVAAAVRHLPVRKIVWMLGALLSAASLFGMAWAALALADRAAAWVIVLMLVAFSLARGICSVSAKDVLGKTISKSRRGTLMGWSASLSGLVILALGAWLAVFDPAASGIGVFAALLAGGGLLWIVAALAFAAIEEQPGATEGGGNAISVAVQQLGLLVRDRPFRRFVTIRGLLLAVALAPPFYVLVAQQNTDAGLAGLGALIIANGLASSISSPFWGYLGDRSSRSVMALAAGGAGTLALLTWAALILEWQWLTGELGFALIFLVLNVMHGGVRLGRKVYLVDMASAETRAAYVAVSNTTIGVLMLFGGLIGLVGDWLGAASILLLLGLLSLVAACGALRLPEVSEP